MSKALSITLRAKIAKLKIKFICPVCNRNDEMVILNPRFYTDNFLTSVRNKSEYFTERICRGCYSEMQVKYIQCDL